MKQTANSSQIVMEKYISIRHRINKMQYNQRQYNKIQKQNTKECLEISNKTLKKFQ